MSGVRSQIDDAAPPDEWLALSDAERADVQRRAVLLESDQFDAAKCTEVSEPAEPQPVMERAQPQRQPPTVEHATKLAESLELHDRMRLVARLWASLPVASRMEVISLGLENLDRSSGDLTTRQQFANTESLRPLLWRRLFDPASTSELYSAPRRFDLATMFVGTAAYSILFGMLSALDAIFHYGPLPLFVLASVIAVVAAAQAFWYDFANPRGVSVIAGTAAFTSLLLLLSLFHPRADDAAFFLALMSGLLIGPMLGYFAGVLVGGVFLVADLFRQRYAKEMNGDASALTHPPDIEGRPAAHPLDELPSSPHQ